jgi:hypothetical protein
MSRDININAIEKLSPELELYVRALITLARELSEHGKPTAFTESTASASDVALEHNDD